MPKKSIRKYQVLLAGAFAIFFTGFPHIWSVYQPYVMENVGWTRGQTSLCFYIYFVVFVGGNILGGRLQDRYSPKVSIVYGGGIFTASLLAAAFCLRPSPIGMYLTYGVMQGIGQGMIYSTIISTAQKWYPKSPGFASGVIVTANGLFGFFMAPLCKNLLEQVGIQKNLLLVGALVGLSWILSAVFVDNPPEWSEVSSAKKEEETLSYCANQMVRMPQFYFLTLTMFLGWIPYMLMSPLAQSIQTDRGISVSTAVAAVMAGSVCNASARLVVPTLADRFGRILCVKVVLVVTGVSMVLLATAPVSVIPAAIVLVYGCYGGIMGSFPSLCSRIFGMRHSGENYGYVMLGLAAATLCAPLISGFFESTRISGEIFWAGALSSLLGLLSLSVLRRKL